MFSYRGIIILIALCAFGAIQASYEANQYVSFKHHGHHNSSNSTHGPSGNHSHPHHPGHNNSHPHHPGHNNSSHPHHPGHNNNTHPAGNHTHPHHPGHNNSHPHHPPGNHSNPYYPGNSNLSYWKVPKRENSRFPFKPLTGFKARPIRSALSKENVPFHGDSNLNPNKVIQPRGIFKKTPSNFSRPIFRPHVIGPWYRPGNYSGSYLG